MQIKIKHLTKNFQIPVYKTEGSAGFDIYYMGDYQIVLRPGVMHVCETGMAWEIEPGYSVEIVERSSLATKGLKMANMPGVIDSDYRGEIKVVVFNARHFSEDPSHHTDIIINPFDRIAQGILREVKKATFTVVDELSDTERGTGGFGSTGR
jgi:dUTP pyrophosphatase